MKKLVIKLIAKILDKWGYKFSITKEEQGNTLRNNLYIHTNSNVGLGSKIQSSVFFQTRNNHAFKI